MSEPLDTTAIRARARWNTHFPRHDVLALCDALDEARRAADLWRTAENAQTGLLQQVFDALGGDPVRDTVDALAERLRADISACAAERDRLAAQVERVRAVRDHFADPSNRAARPGSKRRWVVDAVMEDVLQSLDAILDAPAEDQP